MTIGVRRPWESADIAEIERRFPPPPDYFESMYFDPPETIARRRLALLQQRAEHAYRVPFFKERWDEAGFAPGDLRTIDDLWKVPFYTVDDIRKSIEAHPPFGNYQGVTPDQAVRNPMRVFMSGGTTGKSRPTFYTHWDRLVQGVMNARMMWRQGLRPGDVVLNSWAYGLHNGAFCFDDAAYWWLNCVVVTSGTGNVTSTQKQVELAIEYQANAIMTTGDYLLRLADEAEAMGYKPGDLKLTSLATNIGDAEVLRDRFGLEVFNTYGFHEVGTVAVECPEHDGLHIFEDAYAVQIVDPETGEPLPDGQLGSICVTEFCKTGSPQFRYNVMDLSYLYPPGQCSCGSWTRRMAPFAGRGDNMVKLRGINVWPEGVGEVATAVDGVEPDYFVRAVRRGGRDELIVAVVSRRPDDEVPGLRDAVQTALKNRLGVKIDVEIVRPGALDELTGVNVVAKLKRFRDERN